MEEEIYNKAALAEEKINSLRKLSTKYECQFLMSVLILMEPSL